MPADIPVYSSLYLAALTREEIESLGASPSLIEQMFGSPAAYEGVHMEEDFTELAAAPLLPQPVVPDGMVTSVVPDVLVGVPKEELPPIIDMFEERID
jgi:hypothetical protein